MTKETVKGLPPETPDGPAPAPIDPATGQHKDHWVLSQEERAKGWIRPLRKTYKHEKCGGETSMPDAIAETYAANPRFYGSTFCAFCKTYEMVGEFGNFVWLDDGTKVGT